MFSISPDPILPQPLIQELKDPQGGALVTFEGRVRNHHQGKQVQKLAYQAYDALAKKEGNKILLETMDRFEILMALSTHRTGELQIGEIAVWIGVLSAHRAAAYQASTYIIDEIKKRVRKGHRSE